MTVIRPSSISGINSITGNGGDISIFRADGTPADVTVNNITSGVITATHYGSGANLTNLPAGQLTGTIADARLSTVSSSKLSGALPALDGSALTGVGIGTDGSVNTSGIITATTLNYTGNQNLSHRNIFINGDMTVAQRAYGNSGTTTNGFGSVDRFYVGYNAVDEAPTQAQADISAGTTPYTLGFRKSLKITNGNQTSGAGAGEYIFINMAQEAQNLATSGWNYKSSSSFITLSFWIKSSVAQNFYFQFDVRDGTRQNYTMETGSLTANTWTKITKVIPGNSNLTIDNDNGVGAYVTFGVFWGTNYTASMSLETWGAANDSAKTPDNPTNWYNTNDATLEFTGIQLEVGPVATPFEHLPYAENFRRCARYCYQWIDDQMLGFGQVYSGNGYVKIFPPVPVNMRAKPSVTKNAPTGYWFVSYQGNSGYAGDRVVTVEGNSGSEGNQSSNVFRLFVNGGSNQGNGTTVWCLIHDTAGAYLRLEAEL